MLLEKNVKRSSGKTTQALDIQYFFLTNQIEKGNVDVQYCPTKKMVGDYMTKLLQGAKFKKFRTAIMGFDKEPKNKKVSFSLMQVAWTNKIKNLGADKVEQKR